MKTILVASAFTIIGAMPLAAQTRAAQPSTPRAAGERGYLTITAAAQAGSGDLSDRLFFEANAETGTLDARYPAKAGLVVDGGLGFRVWRQVGIGVGVSHAARSGGASVSAEIPHPFFDDRHRSVSGDASDINRAETALHVQLYYDLRPRGPWRIRLFAGPSYFNVEQEIVTGVEPVETFPYDTAAFGSATSARAKGSAVGYNGGIDVSRMFGRRFAVGALVRYAGASVDVDAPGARSVSTDAGGIQAGAGLRVLF